MKKTILLFVLFISTITIKAQEINWISIDKAIELQKKSPKKIMIDVYTNWCGPCKMLDKNTFHNKEVADYVNKNYYAVKFNAEGDGIINYKGKKYSNPKYDPARAKGRNYPHEFSNFMGITAFPTIVFMDEKAEMIIPLKGYRTPQQLELYLKMFHKNDHNKFSSQEDFQAYSDNFKPQFVN
jgi:thioredoxin-related protein